MEFGRRGTPAAPASQPAARTNNTVNTNGGGLGGHLSAIDSHKVSKLFRIGTVVLLFAVTALVVALTFFMTFGNRAQADSIQKDRYQAVFMNNGQVYFGHINSISRDSIDLRNIYYLQTNSADTTETTTPSNVSLVKLGCELHSPYDQMVINSEQVLFWENLQDKSQVVTAISNYKKQNNNTINCSDQSQNSTQQAPSTSTQATPSPTPTPVKR